VNYRHGFHAGNFVDVHKHVLLIALLDHLRRKDNPFFYLDTHAGRGVYDLTGPEARRTAEWRGGIGRLLASAARSTVPEIARYIEVLSALGVTAPVPHLYPGSPVIACALLRSADRAVCVEKVPDEATALRNRIGRANHTAVLCADGYQQLMGHVPPRERRGIVVIDPPYESSTEFADVATALQRAYARWPTGMYAAWYPIKSGDATELLGKVAGSGIRKVLCCEFVVRRRDAVLGLNGSGILIVNPPWQFDQKARAVHGELCARIAEPGQGSDRVKWLVPE